MARRTIVTVMQMEFSQRGLTLHWPDGFNHTFHPLWLRERSFEASAKDPATGHRLYEAAFLPLDTRLVDAQLDGEGKVALIFGDGHRCDYALSDLKHCAQHPLPADLVGAHRLWDATLTPLPTHDFASLKVGPAATLALIDDLAAYGFAIVGGLSTEINGLEDLTNLIGPIRETNWGRISDVVSITDGFDLSMTPRALEPHVDNPYRLPGPGYIFLHCLRNDAVGGESFLIDGFNVARRLQREAPEAFATLVETQVTFRYADETAILEHYGPLIQLRPDGGLHRTIFHNRADQVPALNVDHLERYYAARRRYADLIWAPEMWVTFKLAPGDGYIVDNYRMFHGRNAFDLATGQRHLRQCYMDRDIMSSVQKTLIRSLRR
jgi:gamma-butyrobetaine dioxygenase